MPRTLLGSCVEQVDNHGSIFVVLFGCLRFAEPAKAAIVVIEGVKRSLGLCCLNRRNGHIATAVHLVQPSADSWAPTAVLIRASHRESAGQVSFNTGSADPV